MTFQDRTTHSESVSEERSPPLPVLRQKTRVLSNPINAAAIAGTVLLPLGLVIVGLTYVSAVMQALDARPGVPAHPSPLLAIPGAAVELTGLGLQIYSLVAGLIRERFRRVPTAGLAVLVSWVILLVIRVLV